MSFGAVAQNLNIYTNEMISDINTINKATKNNVNSNMTNTVTIYIFDNDLHILMGDVTTK